MKSATAPSQPRLWTLGRLGRWGGGVLLVLLFAIQLVPYGRDQTNPSVLAEPAWDRPETRALFMRACADCHSNQTVWPWYSNIAPASWLIARDVAEGREKLNISAWGSQRNEGDDAAEQVQEGEMPPWFYLPLHAEAQLTPTEQEQLIAGLIATFGEAHRGGDQRGDDDGD